MFQWSMLCPGYKNLYRWSPKCSDVFPTMSDLQLPFCRR